MSKQVLDLEQMKHLHELGLDTNKASMQYIENNNGKILCIPKGIEHDIKDVEDGYIICDALTLPDILDLLPNKIYNDCYLHIEQHYLNGKVWDIYYMSINAFSKMAMEIESNLIDAAYKMLCWCIEKDYISTDK